MLISHVDATTLDDIRNRLVKLFNVNYQAHVRGVSNIYINKPKIKIGVLSYIHIKYSMLGLFYKRGQQKIL